MKYDRSCGIDKSQAVTFSGKGNSGKGISGSHRQNGTEKSRMPTSMAKGGRAMRSSSSSSKLGRRGA